MAIGSREDARWGRARVLLVAKRVFSAFLSVLPLTWVRFKMQHALSNNYYSRSERPQLLLIGECASKIKSSLDTKAPVALDTISEEADPRGGERAEGRGARSERE